MKNLLVILIGLTLSTPSFALNCEESQNAEEVTETRELKTDVPSHLKGATIIVRTADGRETSVPAEKFKVVPRVQQFLVTKTKQQNNKICTPEKNRISLLAGNGPKEGLDRSKSGTTVTVESRTGAVGGAQYQRLLTERISVGAQVQTNESVLVNIGLDF